MHLDGQARNFGGGGSLSCNNEYLFIWQDTYMKTYIGGGFIRLHPLPSERVLIMADK